MSYGHYDDTGRPIDYIDSAPHSPYGTDSGDIDSGIRKTLNTCQYWIKGMPGVCNNWATGDPGHCTYEKLDNETKLIIRPDGHNLGLCDLLGRKYGCNKYESAIEDLEKYICVATCPYRSGLWKRDDENDPWRSVKSSEIKGHNADSGFVGQCDGCGFGRGSAGFEASGHGKDCSNGEFTKLYVQCNYYRPWHMGFGVKIPKTSKLGKGSDVTVDKKTGRLLGDERDTFGERLPFSFNVYNVRAKLQKCGHWDSDLGSSFVLDNAGLYLEDGDKCTNPDEKATPYHTEATESPPTEMILENVWSEAGGVICNGARTDCPGYTGNWIYCIDALMDKGDKISAQQILELRFWMSDWASQEEYDSVFKKPPNKADPDTSDIYTYGRWETISTSPADSILLGKKCSLCVPNAGNEFFSDMVQVEEIQFINKGTSAPANKSNISISPIVIDPITLSNNSDGHSQKQPSQVQFPSLIRNMDDLGLPPLNIVYPYTSKDPFNEELNPRCGSPDTTPCIKRNHSMEGDSVSVVGLAVRDIEVYVFNITTFPFQIVVPSIIKERTGSLAVQSYTDTIKLNDEFDKLIDKLTEKRLVWKSESNTNGLFIVGPVDIEYQKLNELVVCYKYDDDWYFRKRSVWSQWHGGVIVQTSFEHEYERDTTYVDDGYHYFTPPAKAAFDTKSAQGNNSYDCTTSCSEVLKANKKLTYPNIVDYYYDYTYCIKKTTVENFKVDRWRRVDNVGTLWLDIDNINLNYIFEWGIDKAEANLIAVDEEGRRSTEKTVDMEYIFPTVPHTQLNIHPNACMIAPKDPDDKQGIFKNQNWEIVVDFWYKSISDTFNKDTNTTVVHPDISTGVNRFVYPSYDVKGNSVENIQGDTVALLGKFVDEDGRLVSTFATKLLVDVARTLSRDVEVKYRWSADYTVIELSPTSGNLVRDENGPFLPLAVGKSHNVSIIPCGDHDMGNFSGIGPMWFPYNSCETVDFYDVWTGANSVVKPHEGTPRHDYRYMTPIENIPFCEPHATWADCKDDWGCYYEKITPESIRFTGYAYKRGQVNVDVYYGLSWALPRFGNVLREYVERFKSIDNISHISFKGTEPFPSVAWAPLVMDDSCFFTGFNSVEGDDDIKYFNQLNFMIIKTDVEESLSYNKSGSMERFRFDDVFGIRRTILASYPEPLTYRGGSLFPYVTYYYFKDDSTQWAWQETWKDIETTFSNPLEFVSIFKPDYIFDNDKREHRFIIEEGSVDLQYACPDFDLSSCMLVQLPYLKLSGGEKRYFKCIYNDYDSTDLVDWADENQGKLDASGGNEDGEKSIYEITCTDPDWIHAHEDKYPDLANMIYDEEALKEPEAAEAAGRKIEISYDEVLGEAESYVYNRGLIAKITKEKLKSLPFELDSYPQVEDYSYKITYSPSTNIYTSTASKAWNDCSPIRIGLDFTKQKEKHCIPCVCRVIITGFEGNEMIRSGFEDIKISISKPSVKIYENHDSDTIAESVSIYQSEIEKQSGIGVKPWTKTIDIEVNPTRMLIDRTKHLEIELTAPGAVFIQQIEAFGAHYISHIQLLDVYERKYNISVGEVGDFNLDGEKRLLSYEYNRDNSGVYLRDSVAGPDEFSAFNKMRSAYGHIEHEDKEEFDYPITNYEALIKVESEQEKLYSAALETDQLSDETTKYSGMLPPNVELFLQSIGASSDMSADKLEFYSEKQRWENKISPTAYKQFEMWAPKGFAYRWAAEHRLARCHIFDSLHKIVQLEFLDVYENEAEYSTFALISYYALRMRHMFLKDEKDFMIGSDIGMRANEFLFRGAVDLVTGGGRG